MIMPSAESQQEATSDSFGMKYCTVNVIEKILFC